MLSVTFAYMTATALLFMFKSTRWMGAVGLFILLTIAPVLSSSLLILLAVVGYFAGQSRPGRRAKK